MSDEVVYLDDHRPGVYYEVAILHRWDGSLSIWVKHVSDNENNRDKIADALRRAAASIDGKTEAKDA